MGRSKFGAVPTVVDGIRFASKGEAQRYRELCLLERADEISDLSLQSKFPLHLNGVLICHYVADFTYFDKKRHLIVEDFKGFRTPEYKIKKKLFEAAYGQTITETGTKPKRKVGKWIQRRNAASAA